MDVVLGQPKIRVGDEKLGVIDSGKTGVME
jgi:hypothetical protein